MTTTTDIYDAYPRKIAKAAAIRAIEKAVKIVASRDGITAPAARAWLLERVQRYASSPHVKSRPTSRDGRSLIPHGSTWFNAGQYDDDEAEWGYRSTPAPARVDGRQMTRDENEGLAILAAYQQKRNDDEREAVRRQAALWWRRVADKADTSLRAIADRLGVAR